MRRGLVLAVSLGFLLAPTSVDADTSSDPDIRDVSGDANFLNTLKQVSTSPASYAAADLVSVDLQTTYVAVPVGESGVDYQPTAMRVVFATTDSPADLPPGGQVLFRTEADTWDFGTNVYLEGIVSKSPTGVVTAVARLRRDGLGCASYPGVCWSRSRPEWSAALDAGQKTLTLTYPFSSLAPEEKDLIGIGAILPIPNAETLQPRESVPGEAREFRIDTAWYGYGFIVGEDVPEDIACTEACQVTKLPCAGEVMWSDNNLDTIIFLGSVNGACKSPEEVHGVELTMTTKRCPDDSACSETTVVEQCPGRKCGKTLTIPYLYTETASYRFVFRWVFDDGDSFEMRIGTICHTKFGLDECPESSGKRLVQF